MTSPEEFKNIQVPFSAISREFLRRMEEGEGLFWVFLPYSDLGRWIPEDGVWANAWRNFPMQRLEGVKSLSFLSYHGPSAGEQYFLPFTHNRLGHTLSVALVGDEILKRNGFPQEERNKIILASTLHDIATPAHGDATKKLDPEMLSEEDFVWEALDKAGRELLEKYGVSREEVDNTIKNKGLYGKVLDIADRITYVMQDLFALAGYTLWKRNQTPYIKDLSSILGRYRFRKIGNIYKDVKINRETQEVFFADPRRLEAFLLLRALLHKNLYMHPVGIGRDYLVANLTKPFYRRDTDNSDLLTPPQLRRMTDNQLVDYLWESYGQMPSSSQQLFESIVNWYPMYERFAREEEAQEFAKTISQKSNIVVVDIVRCEGFDPTTTYRVTNQSGRVMSLKEFDPAGAAEIEAVEQSTHGVFVFYTDTSDSSQPINNLIKIARQKGAFQ